MAPIGAGRVAFATLGCKVNLYDTQAVAGLFRAAGYSVVDFEDEADVYVINTCSVTSVGARKSRQTIRRAHRLNPRSIVVAMGCYSQYAPEEVAAVDGVDVVIGTDRHAEIVRFAEAAAETALPVRAVGRIGEVRAYEEIPTTCLEGRTRAILKVQDGCSESCAYCQIPRARGRSRSRLPKNIMTEATSLVRQGYQEIVLTGVNLGAYGEDLGEDVSLAHLLQQAVALPGLVRLRLSSLDPHQVTPDLVSFMASDKRICRHLHISAQSGSDSVLANMRRRNSAEEYKDLVRHLRRALPGVAITTDIIVGFPGESEACFGETMSFCEEIGFSRIHVFPYSRREGTAAAGFPDQVPEEAKRIRTHRLMQLGDEMALAFHRSLLHHEVPVLLEGFTDESSQWLQGLTDTYVRVRCPQGDGGVPGALVTVRVEQADEDGASGHICG